jgi:hypothetical protein
MFLPIIHILPILTQLSTTNDEEVIKIHFLFSKSSIELPPVTTAARRLYGSTYATPRFMARPSTVTTAIDLSIAKRRCSSTCGSHQRMPRPSTLPLAIDPSATKGVWSSTCGTLAFTYRIRKPL